MKVIVSHQIIRILCALLVISSMVACNTPRQSNKKEQRAHFKKSIVKLNFNTGVRSILEDSKGNIWFGSYNEGACLLQSGKLHYFTTQNGLSDNQVRNIYEDKNGVIWFECGIGLSIYSDGKMSVFQERNYQTPEPIKLSKNDLWFKSDASFGNTKIENRSGVYQYDGKGLYFHPFTIKNKLGQEIPWAKSTGYVRSRSGAVWFGAYSELIKYDGQQFMAWNNESMGLNGTTENLHIRSFIEDSKGNLWIGNNCGGRNSGIGVIKYDGQKFIHFTKMHHLRTEDTKGNSLDKVFSIAEDSQNNIWFGTNESGVWRFDGHSLKNFTQKDGLDNGIIWVIYQSKSGELWFGGGPNGVYRFNGTSFERKY